MSFLKKEAHLFCVKKSVAHGKYTIDKFPTMVYNTHITLSRAAEVTGPMKPQQPDRNASKVLTPAVYPKDEGVV